MKQKCDICGKSFEGYGNNPAPLEGKVCCDNCNKTYVIPARLKQLKMSGKLDDSNEIYLLKTDKGYISENMNFNTGKSSILYVRTPDRATTFNNLQSARKARESLGIPARIEVSTDYGETTRVVDEDGSNGVDTPEDFNLREHIGFLIKDEVEAIEGYDKALIKADLTPEDTSVLEEIRNDELDHVSKLNSIYEKLAKGAIEEDNSLADDAFGEIKKNLQSRKEGGLKASTPKVDSNETNKINPDEISFNDAGEHQEQMAKKQYESLIKELKEIEDEIDRNDNNPNYNMKQASERLEKLNNKIKELKKSFGYAIEDESNLEESFEGGYDPATVNEPISDECVKDDLLSGIVGAIGNVANGIGKLSTAATDGDNLKESAKAVATFNEGETQMSDGIQKGKKYRETVNSQQGYEDWEFTGNTKKGPDGKTLYAMKSDRGVQWFEEDEVMNMKVQDAKMTPERMIQIITPIVRDFAKKKGVEDYWAIHKNGKNVSVGIELGYNSLDQLCDIINAKLRGITESYFEPADGGLIETTIFDSSMKDGWEGKKVNTDMGSGIVVETGVRNGKRYWKVKLNGLDSFITTNEIEFNGFKYRDDNSNEISNSITDAEKYTLFGDVFEPSSDGLTVNGKFFSKARMEELYNKYKNVNIMNRPSAILFYQAYFKKTYPMSNFRKLGDDVQNVQNSLKENEISNSISDESTKTIDLGRYNRYDTLIMKKANDYGIKLEGNGNTVKAIGEIERINDFVSFINEYHSAGAKIKDSDTVNDIGRTTVGNKYRWDERYGNQPLTVIEAGESVRLSLDNSNTYVRIPKEKFEQLVKDGKLNSVDTELIEGYGRIKTNKDKKFSIKVGDRTFVVKAKDKKSAVSKLKKSLKKNGGK